MLGLRLTRGVDLREFAATTGFDAYTVYAAQLNQLTRAGLLRIDNHIATLTETGLNVADAVAAEFLEPSV